MKLKSIYTGLFIILLACLSCSDFLEREPKDVLSPGSFWNSEKDAYLALVGCYNGFESGYDMLMRDCMSDNAYNFHRHEGFQTAATGDISPADPGKSWFTFDRIHRCNNFLANIDQVEFTTSGLKDIYTSEVRFLRAYAYFVRTNAYGDFPFFTENFTDPEEAKISRTSREVVEQFIIDELKDIIPLLPEKDQIQAQGRIGKGAAQALLMRLYLFKQMYTEALKVGQEIKGYKLFEEGYEELFMLKNQINDETILAIERVESDASMSFTSMLPNSAGGWSSVVPTQQLVDSYEMADGRTIQEAQSTGDYNPADPYIKRDPRLRATIIYPGQMWEGSLFNSVEDGNDNHPSKANNATKTGYNFKKYVSNLAQYDKGYWNTSKSIIIFRYAEVLLSMAEAKVELNQIDDELYNYIDQVRLRAGMPKTDRTKYNNQQTLRELVRRERRVEFAYEGMRRYDVIRWDIGKDVLNVTLVGCRKGSITNVVADPETGDVHVNLTGDPFFVEQRTFTDKNKLFPIPQSAIDKNPNLAPNNPGY